MTQWKTGREGRSCSVPSLAALSRRAAAPPARGSAFGLLQFKQHVPPALGAAAAAARPCEGAGRLGSLRARWLASSSAPLPGAREIHRINTHFLFLFMGGGRCALIPRSAAAALPPFAFLHHPDLCGRGPNFIPPHPPHPTPAQTRPCYCRAQGAPLPAPARVALKQPVAKRLGLVFQRSVSSPRDSRGKPGEKGSMDHHLPFYFSVLWSTRGRALDAVLPACSSSVQTTSPQQPPMGPGSGNGTADRQTGRLGGGLQALDPGPQQSRHGTVGSSSMVCKWGRRFGWGSPRGSANSSHPRRVHGRRGSEQGYGALRPERALTLRLLRWMSPMQLATAFGPSSMRVLRGHSVLTRWCSPMRILRTFSAPVTRISGRPSKCVLNTLPYFSLRDDWKPEPCGNQGRDLSQGVHLQMGCPGGPARRARGGGTEDPARAASPLSPQPPPNTHTQTRTKVLFFIACTRTGK